MANFVKVENMNILQVISKLDKSYAAQDVIVSTRFFTLNGHKACVASCKSVEINKIDELGARHYAVSLRPNIFLIPAAVFKLAQIIKSQNIDVVHTRSANASGAAFFAARITGKPYVATIYEGEKRSFLKKAEFWAKYIICSSESRAERLMKAAPGTKKKICIIPALVLPGEKYTEETSNKAFTVEVSLPFSSAASSQSFVRAAAILSRSLHRLKIVLINNDMVSKKDSYEKLKILIRRHMLEGIISFLPEKENIRICPKPYLFLQFQKDADVALRSASVAAVSGIPAITINDEHANPQELAGSILDLYKNEAKRKDMALLARNSVKEKFNTKRIMEETLAIYKKAALEKSILIIKIGALGDVILASPSIKAIHKKFPDSKIKLLTAVENREVFINSPYIDEILVCDFKERDRGFFGLLRVGKKVRSENFDTVVDLQNNKKSHVIAFLSCAPKRLGYDNGKLSFLLNRKIKDRSPLIDPVSHQLKVLGLLGINNIDEKLSLWPSPRDIKWAENFFASQWLKPNTKLVAFNIGSSPKWLTKLWPVEYFVELSTRLAKELGIRIILIGKDDGKKDVRADKFLKRSKCKPINALGKTNIPCLAALIKKCDLLLSADSAPVHIAASVNTPFIALFGPTDPKRHLVPMERSEVFKKDLKCSPCYKRVCDKGYICMRSIKPDEVYTAIVKLLGII